MMKQKVVIKLGGSSLQNFGVLQELVTLVAGYRHLKYDVVLVHGGGPAINQELTQRGIEWKFINGQRQTTHEMMAVIEDVLANKINSMVVNNLKAANIPALGLSGATANTLLCTQANAELMQVGKVEEVNVTEIEKCLRMKRSPTPVLAPIGIGAADEKYNINADWAAAKVAIALQADQLIFLTDQNGILDHDKQLVTHATPVQIDKMIEDGVISGGMYTKVMTMISALNAGVQKVRVLNASVASEILNPLRGHEVGTLLIPTAVNTTTEVFTYGQAN